MLLGLEPGQSNPGSEIPSFSCTFCESPESAVRSLPHLHTPILWQPMLTATLLPVSCLKYPYPYHHSPGLSAPNQRPKAFEAENCSRLWQGIFLDIAGLWRPTTLLGPDSKLRILPRSCCGRHLKPFGVISMAPQSFISQRRKEFSKRQSDRLKSDLLAKHLCGVHKDASKLCAPGVLSGLSFYNQRKRGEEEKIFFVFLE